METTETKTPEPVADKPKTREQRISEARRRFVDENIVGTEEISPKWQRAIDNYRRNKGLDVEPR